jgi:hypothetical protein
VSRFTVQLQPTDKGVMEVVGPIEAACAAGRIHCGRLRRRDRPAAATVRPFRLARFRRVNGRSQP